MHHRENATFDIPGARSTCDFVTRFSRTSFARCLALDPDGMLPDLEGMPMVNPDGSIWLWRCEQVTLGAMGIQPLETCLNTVILIRAENSTSNPTGNLLRDNSRF